jgi:hypothetical protein
VQSAHQKQNFPRILSTFTSSKNDTKWEEVRCFAVVVPHTKVQKSLHYNDMHSWKAVNTSPYYFHIQQFLLATLEPVKGFCDCSQKCLTEW